jgi:hypothetical protein
MPRSAGTKLRISRQAQGARVRSVLRGSKAFRRLLKQLPEEMRVEMAHVLEDVGPKLARQMQARTPRKTGALQAGIKWKVLRATLRLQVGLLGSKRGRAKLFYGYILNFGRKAQVAFGMRRAQRMTVREALAKGKSRKSVKAAGASLGYPINVKAIAAQHFVTGAYPDLRRMTTARLKDSWARSLARIAARGGDDE